jgi:hypothetical protein
MLQRVGDGKQIPLHKYEISCLANFIKDVRRIKAAVACAHQVQTLLAVPQLYWQYLFCARCIVFELTG